MAISIDWGTGVITVPQADLTYIDGVLYEHDVNAFRLALKDLEDSPDGMAFSRTHDHNTEVVLSGDTYARVVEILDPYTVKYEDGQYVVRCVGANHNIADKKVANQVSLIIGNSAGLIGTASAAEFVSALRTENFYGLTYERIIQLLQARAVGKSVEEMEGKFVYYDENDDPLFSLTISGDEVTRFDY